MYCIVLVNTALSACAEPAPPLRQPAVTTAGVLRASSGTLLTRHQQTHWQSVVDSGRIVTIRQQFAGPGQMVGWRVYHYDAQGRLHHFSEGAFGSRDSAAVREAITMRDSGLTVEALGNLPAPVRQRLLVVHFLADVPILSGVRTGHLASGISRPYLATISRQASDLLVLATRGAEGSAANVASMETGVPTRSPLPSPPGVP